MLNDVPHGLVGGPAQDVVAFKGKPFLQTAPEEKPPQVLEGSVVAFTKNGKFQGVAYR